MTSLHECLFLLFKNNETEEKSQPVGSGDEDDDDDDDDDDVQVTIGSIKTWTGTE